MTTAIDVIHQELVAVEEPILSTIEIVDEGTVTVTEEVLALVSEAAQGPQGIQGPQGAPGAQGLPGANGTNGANGNGFTFHFDQALPSSTWTIQHNLNKHPSVAVVDSAGSLVYGELTYIDTNSLRIEFSSSFSGTALLN